MLSCFMNVLVSSGGQRNRYFGDSQDHEHCGGRQYFPPYFKLTEPMNAEEG